MRTYADVCNAVSGWALKYALYLFYWYKSTNTDTAGPVGSADAMQCLALITGQADDKHSRRAVYLRYALYLFY
jgi:hypothetical protein